VTEFAELKTTRAAYDTVAFNYAEMFNDDLAGATMDRAMLGVFAEAVQRNDLGPVADIGCGTGRITVHLDSLGLDVFGIDLSPGMLAEAARRYPHLRFSEGSLLNLDLADASLGGALAWYSLIHTPPELMPSAIAELARVLAPGGQLVVAFQVGDERVRLTQAYGHQVSYDVYRLSPDRITELLRDNGLDVYARTILAPEAPYPTPQAYLHARKPVANAATEQ
jgi:ubiquinone/menaquinone biosynthesis C-methylase UbiE